MKESDREIIDRMARFAESGMGSVKKLIDATALTPGNGDMRQVAKKIVNDCDIDSLKKVLLTNLLLGDKQMGTGQTFYAALNEVIMDQEPILRKLSLESLLEASETPDQRVKPKATVPAPTPIVGVASQRPKNPFEQPKPASVAPRFEQNQVHGQWVDPLAPHYVFNQGDFPVLVDPRNPSKPYTGGG